MKFKSLILIAFQCGVACADSGLEQWRGKADEIRMLAENSVVRAYAEAELLKDSLPFDALPVDRARLLNLLARIEIYRALPEKADGYIQQAMEIAKQNNDLIGQAEADLNIALNAINLARIDDVTEATVHGLAVLDGLDRPDLLGEALLRMSMVYRRAGQFDESVTLALQALDIARQSHHPLALTYAYQGMAISYEQSNRFAEALENYKRMREQAQSAGSRLLEGYALQGIAITTGRLGDFKSAERMIRETIQIYREIDNYFSISFGLFALADIINKQGQYAEALPIFDEIIENYQRFPNKIGLWWTLNARSDNLMALGRISAARQDTERAYDLAREIGSPVYLTDSSRRLASIAAAKGRHGFAYRLLLEAHEMAAKAAKDTAAARMLQLTRRYQTESKQREIDKLSRSNQQQVLELTQRKLEQHWLWTSLGGGGLVLFGTVFFLLRLRRSKDNLEQRVEERTSELLSLQQALEDRNLLLQAEISERKNIEALIQHQACYDPLTGLSNRRMLIDRLREEAAKCNRSGSSLALLFIDLDRFKEVNDSLGHRLGDQLLVQVAERIRGNIRVSDIVARLAGDEFVVILPLAGDDERVGAVGQHIVAALTSPFQLEDSVAYISASIGIACYPEDTDDIDQLLGCADQSMYAVKKSGRNGLSFFTSALQDEAQQRLQLSNDLRNALSLGQLQVHYQPIVNLETLQVEKAEALLRWRHPERGGVRPDLFIPLAEETGLIHEIGDWVFKQAVQTALNWQKLCPHESCQMSVNMSPRQFMRGNPDVTWIEHLKAIGLNSNAMVIEITEGLLLEDQIEVVDKLARFNQAGVQLALDDFGTGYSAMAYLKKFNIDYLKIDRSFVRDLEIDAGDRAIAEAIVVMAHKLGLKVIAEGVETEGQRALLAAAGCEYLQGYLYAKPMIDEDFLDYAMNFNGAI